MNMEGRRRTAVSPYLSTTWRVDRSGSGRTVNTLSWSVCRPKRPDTPETGVLCTAVFSTSASPPFPREWPTAFSCSSILLPLSCQTRRLLSKGAPFGAPFFRHHEAREDLTKNGAPDMIRSGRTLLHTISGWLISCDLGQKEVMRMWKRRLVAVLRFLALCAMWTWILTTKAC